MIDNQARFEIHDSTGRLPLKLVPQGKWLKESRSTHHAKLIRTYVENPNKQLSEFIVEDPQ